MILNLIIPICARPNQVHIHNTYGIHVLYHVNMYITYIYFTYVYLNVLISTLLHICTLFHQGIILNCAIQYNLDKTKPFPHTKEIITLGKAGKYGSRTWIWNL